MVPGAVWCVLCTGVVQSSHVTEIRSQIIQTVGRGLEKDFIFISIPDIPTFCFAFLRNNIFALSDQVSVYYFKTTPNPKLTYFSWTCY